MLVENLIIAPSCWSGSLANIMQSRADAISQLITHERTDISIAAKSVNEELIRRMRMKESVNVRMLRDVNSDLNKHDVITAD